MKDNKEKKGFYLALYSAATVFLLLAFGITILHSANTDDSGGEPYSAVEKSNDKSVNEAALQKTTEKITEKVTEPSTTKSAEKITEITTTTNKTESAEKTNSGDVALFNENDEMEWPVSGQIVMDYSPKTAIYDKTLDQYRTTDSICISAALGESVCAGADGVVTAINKDTEKGVTVSINHGNGWLSTYSQLQDNLSVSEGQTVYKGDKIGTVANPTKYSVEIGPHLEFSVYKDDDSTDPKLILASLD